MEQLLNEVNNIMHGLLGILILITIMIVTFVNLANYKVESAFTASSFITAITSMILVGLGILNPTYAVACWLLFALSLFF